MTQAAAGQDRGPVGHPWLVICQCYRETGKATREWGRTVTHAATSCPIEAAPMPLPTSRR